MNTVIRRPVTKINTDESSKMHTLHFRNSIFTIQKNGTSVLSFRNKQDAVHFGKMLENHFDMTQEWPFVDFEETVLYKTHQKQSNLKYLYTKKWQADELRDFCIRNSFGMLDIFKFEDDKRLVGNSFYWDVPMHMYIGTLNSRLFLE